MSNLPFPFNGTEAIAEAPIDQDLMDNKYRKNIEFLCDEIDNISGGGGGGGVAVNARPEVGLISQGGETNEALYWKKRFHVNEHMRTQDPNNISGFNPKGDEVGNELLVFMQTNDDNWGFSADPNSYLGETMIIQKDGQLSFKIKKGVNFFSVICLLSASLTDSVTVLIDGQTPTALGLVDENGDSAPDTFSTNSAATFYQKPFFYYGLDGNEHIITLTNTDSASKQFDPSAIEVGFKSEDPTIDENVKISKGKALSRGASVNFNETELTFGKTDMNGHTGSIVIDNSDGSLEALDGESPAMTQCRAEEQVDFSSAVTELKVKNNFYFPDNGICILSTPYGLHVPFSYSSKVDTLIQDHRLSGLQWQSQPTEDYTPLDGFDNAAVNTAFGDLNINYWGTAPIEISSSNNRIDFSVTINGVTTTHSATIPDGRYAADYVPIAAAIEKAMQTAKQLPSGGYKFTYSYENQLWSFNCDDNEVTEIQLLFSSGSNVANSIHPTLGFTNQDLTGANSYEATEQRQHLCCTVFERDKTYIYPDDPRCLYSWATDTDFSVSYPEIVDLEDRLGIGRARGLITVSDGLIQLFPDDDCCGLEVNFAAFIAGSMLTYQIDDGQCLYLTQADNANIGSNIRGKLLTAFISFPKGSRKITIRHEHSLNFEIIPSTNTLIFMGARQYFTKPAYEKLPLTKSVIKTFEVSALQLFCTDYDAAYSPVAQDDNVNTRTEVGAWVNTGATSYFNGSGRRVNSAGGYVEFDFTLVGDGGGFSMDGIYGTNTCDKVGMFLSQAAINESTDRIQNNHFLSGFAHYDQKSTMILGLKAGTYKLRIKNEGVAFTLLFNQRFSVYDTVQPQINANTVSDINNTGQSVPYPINVMRQAVGQDSSVKVPQYLDRSGYKEGDVTNINYNIFLTQWTVAGDTATLIDWADRYYGSQNQSSTTNTFFNFSGFFKSVTAVYNCFSNRTQSNQPFIDGVQTLNNLSSRVQVKNGASPSATRSSAGRLFQKQFKFDCSFNAGNTFDCTDTRGLQVGRQIILNDGTNKEKVTIDSIVVGVSFNVKETRSTVVDANVTEFEFQGFHNIKLLAGDANFWDFNSFEYEPLTISPSKSLIRDFVSFEIEKVERTFKDVADGADLYFPMHSDGISGTWGTSNIEVLATSAASTYNIPNSLKNISVGSGTINIRVSSTRLVPVLPKDKRFLL